METKYSHKDFFRENEEIRTFFSSAHMKKNIHSHKFWEIAYVYEGTALIHTPTETIQLNGGDFVLIKPETKHCITLYHESKNTSMWMCCCIFTQKYFENIRSDFLGINELNRYLLYGILGDNSRAVIKLSDDNAQNAKHLLWMLAHEYNHYTDGSEFIMRNAAVNLLAYITRMYEYQNTSASGVVSKSHEIDELAKYIRSNFSYNLSLDFLAQHIHLSREYLSRYFKKHMGKSISEYLLEVRTDKAKQMLLGSTYPITDIAEYCGYASASNFRKAFKKVTGVSPGEYRRTCGKSALTP